MTTIFAEVLSAQTEAFKKALSAGDKAEKAKMAAVYKTAEAMEKGDFQGFKTADGKAIPSKDPLYTFGQILDYCQRFVDNGKKELLLKELKNSKGELIGLRKAKDVLPAIGRDNGMSAVFPKRTVGNTSAPKAEAQPKADNVKTLDITTANAEALDMLSLAQLGALFEAVQTAMRKKMLGDATPSEKPEPKKRVARKQATAKQATAKQATA